ncbi:MAG: N,N-dimethylformamidase beta subunit family domain-containing protein [Candidatus Hydrogenedentota bacterium]
MKQLSALFRHYLSTLILFIGLLTGLVAYAAPADAPWIFIEGYAGQLSVAPGEEVTLHVSTSVTKYDVEITRLGAKTESVWTLNDAPGHAYPVPENASSHGAQWPESFRVTIPHEWRSGYYQVTLRAEVKGGKFAGRGRRTAESTCYFIVRSATPGKDTNILLQLATNTYNAYNNWGGSSLYAYNGRGGIQGNRVSFDRPPISQFGTWELPFVRWAERNGYTIDYAANSDLEFRPELLQQYRLVLSVGHDEYWSAPMRDHLEAFIAKGGNVAFFSGNTACWQVRSEDDGRALICWKQNYHADPVYATGDHSLLTSLWSHHLVKRPENELTGVGFLWGGYHLSHGQVMDGTGAYTVHRPDHWIFEGTGLKRDDTFGSKNTIVGYECDGAELEWRDGLPYPTFRDGTPESFTVLGTAPTRWAPDDSEWYERWEKGRTGAATLGLYTRPGGGTVFTAATTDWAHGLRGGDPEAERITKNILDRLAK